MKEFVGEVFEHEIWYENDFDSIADVKDNEGNTFSDVLEGLKGEKVKIKIEVIHQNELKK